MLPKGLKNEKFCQLTTKSYEATLDVGQKQAGTEKQPGTKKQPGTEKQPGTKKQPGTEKQPGTGATELSQYEALCILWGFMQSCCGCIGRHKKPIICASVAFLSLFALYKVFSETFPNKVKTHGYPMIIYPNTEYKSLQECDVSLDFFEVSRWKAMYIYAFTKGAMWGSDTVHEKQTPQWISQLEIEALDGAADEVVMNKQLNAAVHQTLIECVNNKQREIVESVDKQMTYSEISKHYGAIRIEESMLKHANTVVSNFVNDNLYQQNIVNNIFKYFFKTFAMAIIVVGSGMCMVNLCNNRVPHFCILLVVVVVTVMTFCCHMYADLWGLQQFALPCDLLTNIDTFLKQNAICISNIDPLMVTFAQAAEVIEAINYVGTTQALHTVFLDLPKCTESNLITNSRFGDGVARLEDRLQERHKQNVNEDNQKVACVAQRLQTFVKHAELAISVCSAITSMLSYRELGEHFYAVIRDTPLKLQKDIVWRIYQNCTTIEVAANLIKTDVFRKYLQNAVELWTNTVHGNTFLREETMDPDLERLHMNIKTEKMRRVQQRELAVCQKHLEVKLDDWIKTRVGALLKPPQQDTTILTVNKLV